MSDFDWVEYFILASELSTKSDEKYARASISRAYYAVYNILRLKSRVKIGDFTLSHKEVIMMFKNDTLPNQHDLPELTEDQCLQIGNNLEFLRDKRNDADYKRTIKITQNDAQEVLDIVKHILTIIEIDI